MLQISDDEIMSWLKICSDWEKSGMNKKRYAQKHGLNPEKLSWMYRSLFHKRAINPELHAKLINIVRSIKENGIKQGMATTMYGVTQTMISETINYLSYQERLKEIHKERNLPFDEEVIPVEFVEVKNEINPIEKLNRRIIKTSEPIKIHNQEILEKKNDLEIIIQAGIRVIIAPHVETSKLIKIIELLKDL